MDRHFPRLVIAFLSVCCFAYLPACECLEEDLPKEIKIHSNFSDRQVEFILEAAEEWNAVGREYLGYDIIIYDGLFADEDGFSPLEDADDGNNVIYRVDEPDKYYDYLISLYTGETYNATYDIPDAASVHDTRMLGYSLHDDILIFNFNILKKFDELGEEDEDYSTAFRLNVLHELGHWIGLQHVPAKESDGKIPVMYSTGNSEDSLDLDPPYLTQADIQAFCLAHDCLKQP